MPPTATGTPTRVFTEDIISTDRDGRRTYQHPIVGPLVSITTVTGGTSAKPWLAPWAAKLAARWVADNLPGLVALMGEGTANRGAVIDAIAGQAARERDRKADAGKYVHAVVEALLLWQASPDGAGRDVPLPDLRDDLAGVRMEDDPEALTVEQFTDAAIEGFLAFVADWAPTFEAAEMPVFQPTIGYAGTLDSIVVLPGIGRCVMDVKTGKYLDPGMVKQLAALRRAKEALMPFGELAPMPATDGAVLLHLRPEYERGYRLMHVRPEDDTAGWKAFVHALNCYQFEHDWTGKPGKVIWPPAADGTPAPTRLDDLDDEGYGRAPGALIKAGYVTVEEVAALTSAEVLAIHGIGPVALADVRRMLADHGITGVVA